jgi:hypothetical protein
MSLELYAASLVGCVIVVLVPGVTVTRASGGVLLGGGIWLATSRT